MGGGVQHIYHNVTRVMLEDGAVYARVYGENEGDVDVIVEGFYVGQVQSREDATW